MYFLLPFSKDCISFQRTKKWMKGNCKLCNSLQKEVQRIITGYHLPNYILRLGVYVGGVTQLSLTLTQFKTQIVHFATLIKTRDHPINHQHSRSLLTPKKPPCVRYQMKLHTLFKIKTLKTIPYTAAHSVTCILVGQIRECHPPPPRPSFLPFAMFQMILYIQQSTIKLIQQRSL